MTQGEMFPGMPKPTHVRNPVKGYAARPGTGPPGETCRSCRYSAPHGHGTRTFWKCDLVRPTSGPGTDIRLKSPACARWQAPEQGDR